MFMDNFLNENPLLVESVSVEKPTPDLKGKLLRITWIFKRPVSGGKEGLKASGVIGKIKGIFSRS